MAIHGLRLNLLNCQVGLWVCVNNSSDDLFSLLQNRWGGTEPNAAHQRIKWQKFLKITGVVLHGIYQQPRAFTDKIGIERLSPRNLFSQQVSPVLMPRCDPGPRGRAQRTD